MSAGKIYHVPCCVIMVMTLAIQSFILTVELMAEILPEYNPPELTRYSDLVVLGTLKNENDITVHEILKGDLEAKNIEIIELNEFENEGHELRDADGEIHLIRISKNVDLDNEILVFLNLRRHGKRIVANGVFRTGNIKTEKGVFGYVQGHDGYELDPKMRFKSMNEVKGLLNAELKAIPVRQEKGLQKIKKAMKGGDLLQAFHDLERITRFGDMDVLEKVVALKSDERVGVPSRAAMFIQNVGDPKGAPLLEDLYNEHHDGSILRCMGRLGNPRSLAYLDQLILNPRTDKPLHALHGMRELYLAAEAKGDVSTCEKVRERIYFHVDRDLMNLMMTDSGLLGVIPHEGSLIRLEKAYRYHLKKSGNTEQSIMANILRCKKKMRSTPEQNMNER